nr:retrovirus-related Pol polyprotein from transposon TNT 1-94 [Tanacetum cinerariifolium]
QQLEPKLYDGNVIEKTSAIVIPDTKETLMLAEESRSNMLLKQKDPMMLENKVNTTPVDYANSMNSPKPTFSSRPTIVEVPKELPKASMVNMSLKKLKHHLAGFDAVVKERTTATSITKGSWALNDDLRKLKGKALADDVVTSYFSAPEMLKVDVEPLAPNMLNNKTVHSDYLRHTQEQAVILREHSKINVNFELICVKCNACMLSVNHDLYVLNDVNARAKSKSFKKNLKRKVWKPTGKVFTNIGYTWRPTSQTFTIVGNAFPLTRITTTTEMPSRKPDAIETDTPKPVVTLVYSRKPKKSKCTNNVSKSKVIKSVPANKNKPSKSWGSKGYNVPSSSVDAGCPNYSLAEAVATACYTQNRSIIRLCHGKTPYEFLHDKLPYLSFFHVFGSLCYPINDSENLGKLQPKANIGIFIGYAPTKKAFRIYNRRTRRIIKTIHVDFYELTVMASEHNSSGPTLHEMTPTTISSGLVPNTPHSTLFVPPLRIDWDILFQPLFDELLTPPPSVDHPAREVIAPIIEVGAPEPVASTGSPSSTTVDQDAPSPSNSQTTTKTQSPIIPNDFKEDNHDLDVAHMNNNPKWTKDHLLDIIIGELARPVFTRMQLYEQVLFCYYDVFLTFVEPKTYKDALTQSCWFKAILDAIRIFLAFAAHKNMVIYQMVMKTTFMNGNLRKESPRGIFINQSKYALESLKKYGFYSCVPVDTPMMEKSKLDEDKEGKTINPSHYPLVDVDHVGCQDTRHSTSGSMQFLGDRLVRWSSKRHKSAAISSTEAEYIALSVYCAQVLWMLKHIDIRFHFIKEHVENGVIKLYFVNTEYQLADIFTEAIGKERIKFLINKVGMRSFTSETLKQLADKVKEYW